MEPAQPAVPAGPAAADRLDRQVIVTGLVVISGMIMVLLDTTIVNVALDTLSEDLHAPLPTAQWVVTGYLLAVGMAIPVTGWAVDRFGAKSVWIISLVLFASGSGLCAVSWSIESLIVFRILQGLGGGMLMPCGQTIIARAAGPARMGRAMSLLGVPMLLGPVLGPVIGGLLVEHLSWHWIFLVNLPVAVLAVLLAKWRLPGGRLLAAPDRLDWRGLVLLSGGLVCLLYGLSEAGSRGAFTEWGVLGWLIGGGTGIALFTAYSLRHGPTSVIDVRLFTNRLFASGSMMIFLVGIALFGAMLLMPLYYQIVRGEGPVDAGLLLAPQGLGAMVAMPLAGWLTDRFGAGMVVPVGVALALLGTLPFTQVSDDSSYAGLSAALFLRGIGLGATMMPTIAAAYSRLSEAAVSRAAPTISALQQVGGSFGSALLVMVLTHRASDEFRAHGLTGAAPGAGDLTAIPPELLARVAPLLANAFGDAFWVAFGLTAVVLLPALLLPRKPHRGRRSGPAPAQPPSRHAPGG